MTQNPLTDHELREYKTVRTGAGLFDLSLRGKITVTGADRAGFLNSILSNDIKNLRTGEGCLAAFLNATAKVLMMMNVLVSDNHILLDVENGYAAETITLLEKYIITEDVQLADSTNDLAHLSVQGPKSGFLLNQIYPGIPLPQKLLHHTQSNAMMIFRQTHTGEEGYDLLMDKNQKDVVAEKILKAGEDIQIKKINEPVREILRIEAGILRYGIDITNDIMLPETGLEKIAASETKGCYPGQEVVAKIETYGRLNRKIVGITVESGGELKPEDKIYLEGKEVGTVLSGCYSPALLKQITFGIADKTSFANGIKITAGENKNVTGFITALPFINPTG